MFGKPVVGCRWGGMEEVIAEGVTRLLAEPGDAQSLQACLACLIGNESLRKELGRAGRQRYARHYTREEFTARTLDLYREVLRAGQSAKERESATTPERSAGALPTPLQAAGD